MHKDRYCLTLRAASHSTHRNRCSSPRHSLRYANRIISASLLHSFRSRLLDLRLRPLLRTAVYDGYRLLASCLVLILFANNQKNPYCWNSSRRLNQWENPGVKRQRTASGTRCQGCA
ncbi:hypothetical protein T440DRAFT_68049 [Plenodomus tracheiphilus IPT5]|uniref:Uncharacterized protein n=1 Tax=Plenodomus tracheiphilus IPT5 TaxID=1408161 RepID=A0A6A7B8R8_9PLEO|nr:hypothetical protein T440DRAFT_68049 [Plenodomus tracheiphilus IPT5]